MNIAEDLKKIIEQYISRNNSPTNESNVTEFFENLIINLKNSF